MPLFSPDSPPVFAIYPPGQHVPEQTSRSCIECRAVSPIAGSGGRPFGGRGTATSGTARN